MDDLALVDLLARAQLEARRRGFAIALVDPPPDLAELLGLCGLADALGLDPRWQAEVGEQLLPDEVVQPGDAPP